MLELGETFSLLGHFIPESILSVKFIQIDMLSLLPVVPFNDSNIVSLFTCFVIY